LWEGHVGCVARNVHNDLAFKLVGSIEH
jgi:hypothetical protein